MSTKGRKQVWGKKDKRVSGISLKVPRGGSRTDGRQDKEVSRKVWAVTTEWTSYGRQRKTVRRRELMILFVSSFILHGGVTVRQVEERDSRNRERGGVSLLLLFSSRVRTHWEGISSEKWWVDNSSSHPVGKEDKTSKTSLWLTSYLRSFGTQWVQQWTWSWRCLVGSEKILRTENMRGFPETREVSP